MSKPLVALLFIILLLGHKSVCLANDADFWTGTIHFKTNNLKLKIEIAANQKQRETGLMYRKALASDQGMLFVFEEQAIISIWMKNTQIPLDVLFIDQAGKIVNMLKNLPPCKQTNCAIYHSVAPASFMLEVNAGFIEQQRIQAGQELTLPF